ncbi:MAG: hypothetical protein QNJ90_15145 [Planctomycetota bacterium]|nr:hypothetical protein [Planctomycetota bacterium]
MLFTGREPAGPEVHVLKVGVTRFENVPSGGIALDTVWGRILLRPGTDAQLNAPESGSLLLTVFAGRAVLADGAVGAGREVFLRAGLPLLEASLPSADVRATLDGLIADVRQSESDLDPTSPTYVEELRRMKTARSKLLALTEERSELFIYILPRVLPIPSAEARRDVRDRTLELLARDPRLRAARRLGRELERDASTLETETLLALASRGLPGALRELGTRLDSLSGWPRLRVAAHFGLREDARGLELLREGLRDPLLFSGDPDLYLATVVALERLGQAGHWRDAWARMRDAVARQLDAGRTDTARQEVLRLGYFHTALRAQQPLDLSRLSEVVARYAAKDTRVLQTGSDIQAELERLGQ